MKLKVPKMILTESCRSVEIMLELGIINLLTLFKLKSLNVYKITQKVCVHCKQCVLNYRKQCLHILRYCTVDLLMLLGLVFHTKIFICKDRENEVKYVIK